ncbi:molybdopterin oxidoreductase family protein [Tomitella gaofuii]|uniref:molybdopterin oxidoreductase family protein n=1 Tax=Tomitella gaofuii TaxID=2760083 RepID=UPI0015FA6E1B|nr:molybdopterin oxidoreductase family protein [Tomitella gaofuii]
MTATHCPYCGLQCAMTVLGDARNRATVTARDFPTNRGGLCQKGWTSAELLTHPDRLITPLVRDGAGALRPATWNRALDAVADGIRRTRRRHGRNAVAVYGSGGLTNEKAYMLGKFARVAVGTANIDYNGRFCMSSAAAAARRAFGVDRGMPFPVSDLTGAGAIMLAGANIAETMPPLLGHLRCAADDGGLIVVDPRRTPTAELAEQSGGVHLPVAPGTDTAVALGMLHIAVTEGYADQEFIDGRTRGFDAAWAAAGRWWPHRVESVTGVSADALRRAVRILAGSRDAGTGSYILTGRGAEQHAHGTDTVSAVIDLALAMGLPGRHGCGYGTVTGQGNGQGGREHGQKADQLPGYRNLSDALDREHIARVWDVPEASLPDGGASAYELFDRAGMDGTGPDGGVRALLVHGANPAVSAPHSAHVVERLRSLDLLVVSDFVLSETAAMADVVLPVLQWAEEDGTTTSLEGRVLRRLRAVSPPPGARSELQVLSDLAQRLGHPPSRFPATPRAVFEELRRASAGGAADYAGISYERLDRGEALHWPCPAENHPGTPRLFLDRFATPDGRARFAGVDHRGPGEATDDDHPLFATTGRILTQYQSGAQTRRIAELVDVAPEAFVQVHPDTAERSNVHDGALARVVGRRGTMTARVRVDEAMRPDTVFVPFHFPGRARANLLTNPLLDPTSRMPEFKVCAVRLEAL